MGYYADCMKVHSIRDYQSILVSKYQSIIASLHHRVIEVISRFHVISDFSKCSNFLILFLFDISRMFDSSLLLFLLFQFSIFRGGLVCFTKYARH